MADSDPISDYTPAKRRKINHTAKAWDEADDSGDDLFEDHETIATLPVTSAPTLGYSTKQFHSDINTLADNATQPTQPLSQANNTYITQPTQPLKRSSPAPDDVQVQRSSPPPAAQPAPVKTSFAKPRSFLASAMAPPGTSFRKPQGVQAKPKAIPVDDDSDEDPEVHHSSDEETQGLRSNIRPTNFTKGGRGLNSSPNRRSASRESPVVRESPKPVKAGHQNGFLSLMADFGHKEPAAKPKRPADDMASAYGSSSRSARPPPQQQRASAPVHDAVIYKSLDDIPDYANRKTVERMVNILNRSVHDCMQALLRKRGNEQDAMEWLADNEGSDLDELAPTPARPAGPKGVARSLAGSSSQSSQVIPPRSNARADVKVQAKTIAERYAEKARKPQPPPVAPKPSTPAIEIADDEDEEDVAPRPRGRLIQRSRPVARSPTPETSAPKQQVKKVKKAAITIESDESEPEAEHSADDSDNEVEVVGESSHDIKLLKFFNEATLPQIADLCASPESDVQTIIDKRPFNTLEEIRVITNAPEFTKSGKKSRTKPIGDKIVDACSEMLLGYDAVDDLVTMCAVSYTHL